MREGEEELGATRDRINSLGRPCHSFLAERQRFKSCVNTLQCHPNLSRHTSPSTTSLIQLLKFASHSSQIITPPTKWFCHLPCPSGPSEMEREANNGFCWRSISKVGVLEVLELPSNQMNHPFQLKYMLKSELGPP